MMLCPVAKLWRSRIGALALACLTLALAVSKAEAEATRTPPPGRTVASTLLQIPSGQSYWQQQFVPPAVFGPLMVLWEVAPSCKGFAVNLDVQDAASGAWHKARVENNAFIPEVASVSSIRYNFFQNALPYATCRVLLHSLDATPPTRGTRVLAGVVEFAGGYVEHASLVAEEPLLASEFEVLIPNYCHDLQVLKAKARAGEHWFEAKPVTNSRGRYLLPQAYAIDSIELELIGPRSQSCQLPVYAYKLPAPAPGPGPGPAPAPSPTTPAPLPAPASLFEGAHDSVEALEALEAEEN